MHDVPVRKRTPVGVPPSTMEHTYALTCSKKIDKHYK